MSDVRAALGLSRPVNAVKATLADYYELSKPRIVYLLLITTVAAMIMAARGIPPLPLLFWTVLGGGLAAASAGAFNCVYDGDIDRLMRRTAMRPVPLGRISPRDGILYATAIGAISLVILYVFVNPLAAWIALAGNVYYVLIYTIWLKRITPLNIVIGGAAGAVPPLVGWAAVTHQIGGPALGLFALIFLWTPPHFWALALMTENDYAKAHQARDRLLFDPARRGLAGALSAPRHGLALLRRRGGARRHLLGRRAAHVASRDQRRGTAPLQIFASVPGVDVPDDGDRPDCCLARRVRRRTPRRYCSPWV
jgi:hypothetical protein